MSDGPMGKLEEIIEEQIKQSREEIRKSKIKIALLLFSFVPLFVGIALMWRHPEIIAGVLLIIWGNNIVNKYG